MADQTGGGRGGRRQQQPEPEPQESAKAPAKRKILKRERVIVLPDASFGPDGEPSEAWKETLKEVGKAMGLKSGKMIDIANAWVVVAENEAESQDAAIVEYAGEPGTPDAKPGIWRAVPVRGWGDATLYERPPEPKVEASKYKGDD